LKHTEEAKEKMRLAARKRWGDPVDRLWSLIDRSGGPDACWPWMSCRERDGYGVTRWKGKRTQRVHRIVWEVTKGKIPKGKFVCHACDNPSCVNPKHLYLGTPKNNTEDLYARGSPVAFGPGEDHPMAKLTENDVIEIRRLHATGIKSKDMEKRFGISQASVSLIVNRKGWTHI